VHGSAPDIAGQGKANPTALLLAAAMMLDHVQAHRQGHRLRSAIDATLNIDRVRTGDLGGQANTKQFTAALVSRILNG
jgi:isocitrate dehydrogenase (NAD+)